MIHQFHRNSGGYKVHSILTDFFSVWHRTSFLIFPRDSYSKLLVIQSEFHALQQNRWKNYDYIQHRTMHGKVECKKAEKGQNDLLRDQGLWSRYIESKWDENIKFKKRSLESNRLKYSLWHTSKFIKLVLQNMWTKKSQNCWLTIENFCRITNSMASNNDGYLPVWTENVVNLRYL